MKKILFWAVLFISFAVYGYCGEKKIKFTSLPKVAQEFYTRHFGTMKIKDIEFDNSDREYEIDLWNKGSIKFNNAGQWVEIDANKDNPVPSSVMEEIPLMVRNKITRNYTGQITEIKRYIKNNSGNNIYKFTVYEKMGDIHPIEVTVDSNGNELKRNM